MNEQEKFAHRIRIAQLVERHQGKLAQEYRDALSSEKSLAEFFEKLDSAEHQIHDLVLLTPDTAGMYAYLIFARDLKLRESHIQPDDALLEAAARVFIVGFYQKMKPAVQAELQQYPVLQSVYERGKRK